LSEQKNASSRGEGHGFGIGLGGKKVIWPSGEKRIGRQILGGGKTGQFCEGEHRCLPISGGQPEDLLLRGKVLRAENEGSPGKSGEFGGGNFSEDGRAEVGGEKYTETTHVRGKEEEYGDLW